jgi:hypothetical protein
MVPMDPGGTRDDGMLGQIIRHWCSRDTIVGGKIKIIVAHDSLDMFG